MEYGYMIDLQQFPPTGWCPICGREIYTKGENLCNRCRKEAEF